MEVEVVEKWVGRWRTLCRRVGGKMEKEVVGEWLG